MTSREARLETAQRHVLESRKIVERQRAIIEQKKRLGIDTGLSEHLLKTFERTLATFEDDLMGVIGGTRL